MNWVALNMGYHNEHHDLPSIPWNNLPKLRAMAPEFYENLKYHSSWSRLLFQFIFDKRYSLYSRVERMKQKDGSTAGSQMMSSGAANLDLSARPISL
jgi:sphingolipid delta-4 desaturase